MDPTVEVVRRFNRFYTERIGVLDDRYLGQGRPLSEARLLFEVGRARRSVRELRRQLGLDSGYLARLLRSLERQGMVTVAPDPADGRARTVLLTGTGTQELDDLDRRADAAARDLIGGLSQSERSQLRDSIRVIHRLLLRAQITIAEADPGSPDAKACLLAYADELGRRFPEGFDRSELVPPEGLRAAGGVCLVARAGDRAVGCGVLRPLGDGVSEIKHLWVEPAARGLGVSRLLLEALEARAAPTVRLDTHGVLTEAIALYRRSAYREIPPYGSNPHAHVFFEKRRGG